MILGIGWIRLMPIVRQAFDRLAMAQERISALLTDHLLGDRLRSQTEGRQASEVMVWTTAATGIEYRRVGRRCNATFRGPSRWRLRS